MSLGILILACVLGTVAVVVALAFGSYVMPYVLGGLVIALGIYEGWQRGGDWGWIIALSCGLGGAIFMLGQGLTGNDQEDNPADKTPKEPAPSPRFESTSPVFPAGIMTPTKACYRRIPRYKYQLVADCVTPTAITGVEASHSRFIELTADGKLTIRKSYAWDGPSGPTIDTPTFMRGSLVHDALYQLMRLGPLNRDQHRKAADQELRRLCREDGMSPFRAWYVYWAVRLFGKKAATMRAKPDRVVCAP